MRGKSTSSTLTGSVSQDNRGETTSPVKTWRCYLMVSGPNNEPRRSVALMYQEM